MLELYHGGTSVCSSKVRLGLAEKGVEWKSHPVALPKGEQNNPDYLKLNPKGVVPTLVNGDLVVVESSVILEYIDGVADGPALMPKDLAGATKAKMWLAGCIDIHAAINTITFTTVQRGRILKTKTPEEIEASIQRMANPATAAKRREVLSQGIASPQVDAAFFTLYNMFNDMQSVLSKTAWLLGDDYSIADTAILSYVDRLDRLGMSGLWADRYPEVNRWLAASRARPSFEIAIGEYTDAADAAKMTEEGSAHWPEVGKRWEAFLSTRG